MEGMAHHAPTGYVVKIENITGMFCRGTMYCAQNVNFKHGHDISCPYTSNVLYSSLSGKHL